MNPKFHTSARRPSKASKSARLSFRRGCLLSVGAITLVGTPNARAATYDYNGSQKNMSNTAAYTPASLPTGNDIIRWNLASYGAQPKVNAALTFGELWFTSNNTGNITFQAATLILTLNGVSSIGIQMDSGSGSVNLNTTPIALGAAQTWVNNSANTLTLAGVDTNGHILTIIGSGAGNVVFGDVISDIGGLTVNRSGSGAVNLNGINTYSGGTIINGGTLNTGNAAALGAVTGGGYG